MLLKLRVLALAMVFALAGCYGAADEPINPADPVQQQAQAGGSWCIGCYTVSSTYLVDGSSASFRSSGLTIVVPGTRCIDQAAREYIPPGAACSDIWLGFPTATQPQRYSTTVGTYAARWSIYPETVPVGAPPALLWVYEDGYDANGARTSFRWRYVSVVRRNWGVLYRLVDHQTQASIPSVRSGQTCGQLFTYFSTAALSEYDALVRAGYQMDILNIAAFAPQRDGDLELRLGRNQLIPRSLQPGSRVGSTFSPQLTVFSEGVCWFAVNYGDGRGEEVFSRSSANRNEFLTQYFSFTTRP